jgi:FKBP-type peptidyl-prolyl cis-trans isomerase FkpA
MKSNKRLVGFALLLPLAGLVLIAAKATQIIPVPLKQVIPAKQRECKAVTPSGLGYLELRPGTGPRPGSNERVTVNYIGYLAATGEVFDQGEDAQFRPSGVIDGFAEGLQMMPKGSVYRFCIPAALGYGSEGTGPIPANAALVFQVELK